MMIATGGRSRRPRPGAKSRPPRRDGLVRITSKKLKFVYLAPGADFRSYTKVMVDPTQVAFDKKWLDNYNENAGFGNGISGFDITQAVSEGVKKASGDFDKAFADGGYPVVAAPGPNVLRVATAIANIQVAAPDVITAPGRTFSTSEAAGSAMFVLEARDSQSNALMGRAVDARLAGDNDMLNRNSVTNWMDFEALIKKWAQIRVILAFSTLETGQFFSALRASSRNFSSREPLHRGAQGERRAADLEALPLLIEAHRRLGLERGRG